MDWFLYGNGNSPHLPKSAVAILWRNKFLCLQEFISKWINEVFTQMELLTVNFTSISEGLNSRMSISKAPEISPNSVVQKCSNMVWTILNRLKFRRFLFFRLKII